MSEAAVGAAANVVGAGPSGLMAAEVLAKAGVAVTVYDRMPTPGRKFLLAGRGGLNLTHSEPFAAFCARYGAAADRLAPILAGFSPDTLRAWAEELGEPTIVGSSGRVFPRSWKASPLLRLWLARLARQGVAFRPRHRWTGWDRSGALRFDTPDGPATIFSPATVLALGGGSWPSLGSDGAWLPLLDEAGVPVTPLRSANAALRIAWSEALLARFEGQPIKGVRFAAAGLSSRGEATVTRAGLEGGGVYPFSAALSNGGVLQIDLKPDTPVAASAARWSRRATRQSLGTALRKELRLSPLAAALLRETTPDLATRSPDDVAARVHAVPLRVDGVAPLARAISSAGGVALTAVDEAMMLHAHPGTFVAGEMLDWTAPTGGYLLQAAFALGAAAGAGAAAWLARR